MPDDILWDHFVPLWQALGESHQPTLIGGYALVLKDRWLRDNPNTNTVLAPEFWQTARATFDMDMVLRFEVLLNSDANKAMRTCLQALGWQVDPKPRGKNWRFVKQLGEQTIKVELQAPEPTDANSARMSKQCVMPIESLGERGVHAYRSPECVLTTSHASQLTLQNAGTISLAHPVNMAVMKFAAMKDCFEHSETQPEDEDFLRSQAAKHANDILHALAMATQEEVDGAGSVLADLQQHPVFAESCAVNANYFGDNGWGRRIVTNKWDATQLPTLFDLLNRWFPPAKATS